MKIPLLFFFLITTAAPAAWQTSDHVTVWTSYPNKQRTFTWSGTTDAEGKADGPGTYTVYFGGKKVAIYTGTMTAGRMAGNLKAVYPQKGIEYSGEMRDGSENGMGTMTLADGTLQSGRRVDGVLVEPSVEKAVPIETPENTVHYGGHYKKAESPQPVRTLADLETKDAPPAVVRPSDVPATDLYGVFAEDSSISPEANRILTEAETAYVEGDYTVSGQKALLVIDLLNSSNPDHIAARAPAQAVLAGTYTGIGIEIDSKKGPDAANCYRKALRAVAAGIPEDQALKDRLKQQFPDIYAHLLEEKGRAEIDLRIAPGSSSRDSLKCWTSALDDWDEALKICRSDLEAAKTHYLISRTYLRMSMDGFDAESNDSTAFSEAEKALDLSAGQKSGRLIWAKALDAHAWAITEAGIHHGITRSYKKLEVSLSMRAASFDKKFHAAPPGGPWKKAWPTSAKGAGRKFQLGHEFLKRHFGQQPERAGRKRGELSGRPHVP